MAASADNDPKQLIAPFLLLLAAVFGFIVANSGWSEGYLATLNTKISFSLGNISIIDKSILLLVNDGLMAIFFLFIGLELKREVVVGELSNLRKAMFPIACAIGGMVFPALIYFVLNPSGPSASGWGIPMATDIAFALGVLAVLGSRVPLALKILLAAIAIVDDLGAILVIAIFYTAEINFAALGASFGFLAAAFICNRLRVMKLSIYLLLAVPIWYFMLKSGVHATIAGVLVACMIPLAPRNKSTAKLIADIFEDEASPLDSPAVFLEKSLLPWVNFLIIPIFAFCNSGVGLDEVTFGSVAWGVILGLVLGKAGGVLAAAFVAVKSGIAQLPKNTDWMDVLGLGCLAGIGFTMSLFIGSLAFTDAAMIAQAKIGILVGSVIAGTIGTLVLVIQKRPGT